MKKLWSALLAMGLAATSFGGGFQVALQGQKQIGMAHIGVPFKLDAASIYFNPGALPMLENQFNASVGFSPLFSNVAYYNEEYNHSQNADNPMGTPFSVYANYLFKEKFSFGVGVYTPFGSAVVWDDAWSGKYLIQNIQLRSIFIQPTVGYKITDNIGVGAGFIYATGNVAINRALPLPIGDGSSTVELNGKAQGFGANVGVYADLMDKVHVGLTYKSQIKMEAKDGDAKFVNVPSALGEFFPAENKFSTTLNLPGSVNFGAAYDVSEKLKIAVELNYVMWSAYDSLIFDFKTNTDRLEDSRNPREYSNTLTYRIGAQYELSDKLMPRVGFYYDPSPIGDEYFAPETPNCNNLGFTAGLSWLPIEKLSVDLSFLYIHGLERTTEYKPANFGGSYKTNAFVPGIGLSYQF